MPAGDPGGGTVLTKPEVRVAQAWRHVVTALWRDLPDGLRRSAKARQRMTGRR